MRRFGTKIPFFSTLLVDAGHRRLSPEREQKFPGLTADNYHVTSDETPRGDYNCAAWALEITDAKWWPGYDGYWPTPRQDDSLDAFKEGYALYGFEECETPEPEPGYIKLAIFARGVEPLHVARQLDSGDWTSKLGWGYEDIVHPDLEAVICDNYGTPTLFLRKRIDQAPQAPTPAGTDTSA